MRHHFLYELLTNWTDQIMENKYNKNIDAVIDLITREIVELEKARV